MTDPAPPSPLATPAPWDLVSAAYAEEILPTFAPFSEEALRIAGVSEGTRVLDVACGPGTLTLLAARRGATVDALDFSAGMCAQLRAALSRDALEGVRVHEGDGQNVPFDDASYDAAFSMFGLFFFPDRARGFAELRRCLVDGGVAVVSSWHPMEDNVPFFAALFEFLRESMPELPFGRGEQAPLSDPDVFRDEMTAAGFRNVEVREAREAFTFSSLVEAWGSMQRTMAPLAMLASKMGPAWQPVGESVLASLSERFGDGPQTVTLPAWLGVGYR